jgi:heterodisulfide reductase subunit A2
VDTNKCIACGACAEKCPKKITDKYNAGLAQRKAIYVEYPQAVPLKYVIDPDECIYIQKKKCGACQKKCPVDAVDFTQTEKKLTLNVGSVILAPGFEPFNPSKFDNYQYAKNPNVITSLEFERLLSASGPTGGHVARPSDHEEPKKIAWFQCVGSRDLNKCDNAYCSSVCCMYAIKEAVIAKEHIGEDLECSIFFMDMRTPGKEFERFYENAKNKSGIKFVRSRVHTITPIGDTGDLELRYVTENGELKTDIFNMVVLSIGLQTPPSLVDLSNKLGIDLTPGKFCKTSSFAPVSTSKEGIFVCGAFQGPKDIPQSVIDSSAAASAAAEILSSARHTKAKVKEKVIERNVTGERPKIGIFVCRCGVNIAGVVDVPSVVEYAAKLPYVEFVGDNLFSCSQDNQDNMVKLIKEKELNRIVVAACTPKTHEPLFQETLVNAGLNKYIFEMTNIRNQNSWVHKNNPELATNKAKDLIRMAVAKVALMEPLKEVELSVNQTAMVIGGGIAGLTAAKSFADQGFETHLIERDSRLGGQALNLYHTAKGEDIQKELSGLIKSVEANSKIHLHLNTNLTKVDGFVGNFASVLSSNGNSETLEHGAVVIATGASALKPTEYSFGKDPRIITSLDLDKKLIADDPMLKNLTSAVFIQCVGSREPERMYCSRVCCTHSVENALELKNRNPDMNIYILYRDIRTYGEKEYLYKQAREKGIIFVRYSTSNKPNVEIKDGNLVVTVTDHVLGRPMELNVDLVSLATAIVPYGDEQLANFFKVPMNEDGFFIEKHAKLGPSEFATDGAFLCGLAHYPKPIDESIAQAKAAVSRAVTLLSKTSIFSSGAIAQIETAKCASCGVCVSVCPYSAPLFVTEGRFAGKAEINPALCKGCGLCVASCRSGAIHLKGFDTDQIFSQIFELDEAV